MKHQAAVDKSEGGHLLGPLVTEAVKCESTNKDRTAASEWVLDGGSWTGILWDPLCLCVIPSL